MSSASQVSGIGDDALKSELRKTWENAAPGWAKWEHVFSAGLSDATDTLIDMAGIRPGMRVLDLACGAGSQTIQTAKRVGPSGSIVASDISATMLESVRQSAAAAGLQNVETLECAADEFDETLPPFDAAISRLGLMLFPSPRRALEAVQRVLRPGARFAALVFRTPDNNPFMAETNGHPSALCGQIASRAWAARNICAWRQRNFGKSDAGQRTCTCSDKDCDRFAQSADRI